MASQSLYTTRMLLLHAGSSDTGSVSETRMLYKISPKEDAKDT